MMPFISNTTKKQLLSIELTIQSLACIYFTEESESVVAKYFMKLKNYAKHLTNFHLYIQSIINNQKKDIIKYYAWHEANPFSFSDDVTENFTQIEDMLLKLASYYDELQQPSDYSGKLVTSKDQIPLFDDIDAIASAGSKKAIIKLASVLLKSCASTLDALIKLYCQAVYSSKQEAYEQVSLNLEIQSFRDSLDYFKKLTNMLNNNKLKDNKHEAFEKLHELEQEMDCCIEKNAKLVNVNIAEFVINKNMSNIIFVKKMKTAKLHLPSISLGASVSFNHLFRKQKSPEIPTFAIHESIEDNFCYCDEVIHALEDHFLNRFPNVFIEDFIKLHGDLQQSYYDIKRLLDDYKLMRQNYLQIKNRASLSDVVEAKATLKIWMREYSHKITEFQYLLSNYFKEYAERLKHKTNNEQLFEVSDNGLLQIRLQEFNSTRSISCQLAYDKFYLKKIDENEIKRFSRDLSDYSCEHSQSALREKTRERAVKNCQALFKSCMQLFKFYQLCNNMLEPEEFFTQANTMRY